MNETDELVDNVVVETDNYPSLRATEMIFTGMIFLGYTPTLPGAC